MRACRANRRHYAIGRRRGVAAGGRMLRCSATSKSDAEGGLLERTPCISDASCSSVSTPSAITRRLSARAIEITAEREVAHEILIDLHRVDREAQIAER